MKTLFHRVLKTLAFLVLAAGLAAQADAQLVKYRFTGTKTDGNGDVGTTISGEVTLDLGATPHDLEQWYDSWEFDPVNDYGSSSYYFHRWQDGGFSIDAVTDTGLVAGTSFGGTTVFDEWESDYQSHYYGEDSSYQSFVSYIHNVKVEGESNRGVMVYCGSDNSLRNGTPGVVPNPWDPTGTDFSVIHIYDNNSSTGVSQWGDFRIDSFTLVPTTIIIDGIDTGIDDFQYQGRLVSKHLDDCAAVAKNHGNYVSCVAKLTNALVKAGLLTGKQKGVILDAAAKSSYGK